jgi:tetratricopeptide (TPR) repeat protein
MSMQRAATDIVVTNLSYLKQFPQTPTRPARAAFYLYVAEQLIREVKSQELFCDLGDKLIALAEQAYAFRRGDRIEELSQALYALPLPGPYKSAAGYFRALGLRRRGELGTATSLLERVASEPSHEYTSRAIQSLGAEYQFRGDFESALKLYDEAGRRAAEKITSDPMAQLLVQRNIAVVKSLRGDHRGALADLQRMSPFARAVGSIQPHLYYDYLNSLAVEYGELGRLQEAERASRVALSSPFAGAYPEWLETFDDITSKRQRPSHSAVAVRLPTASDPAVDGLGEAHNLVRLPPSERPAISAGGGHPQGAQARILNFQQWKTTIKSSSPTKGEAVVTAEQRIRMTTGEKLIRLMDLISRDETDDETIDKILEAVEEIVLNRRSEKLD